METEVDRLVVSLVGDLSQLDKAAEEADSVIEGTRQANEQLQGTIDSVTESAQTMADTMVQANEALTDSNKEVVKSVEEVAAAKQFAEEVWKEFVQEVEAEIKANEAVAESNEEVKDSLADLKKEFEDVGESLAKAKKAEDELIKEEEQLQEQNRKLEDSLGKVLDGVKALPGPAGKAVSGFQGMAASAAGFVMSFGPLIPIILATAAAVTVVVGTFSLMKTTVNTVIDEINRLGPSIDKATALGESVGNIQALTFALEGIAGMSEGQVQSSLMNLQKNIGNAAARGGAAAEQFTKMGLSLKELSGKSATEQFKEVAAAMAKVENHAERASLAQKMFGGQGKAILAALEAEGDAIEKNEALARKLGITITDSQAAAIDNAGDAMAALGKVTEGWIMQLTAEAAPVIQAITDWIFEWVPKAGGFSYIMRSVVDTAVEFLGYMLDAAKIAQGIFEISRGNIIAGYEMVKAGMENELSDALKERIRLVREANAVQKDTNSETQIAIDQNEKLNEQAENYALSLADQIAFLRQRDTIGGEKNKKIFEYSVQGVDPKTIESLKYYQSILDDITKTENEKKRAQSLIDKYKTSEERVLEAAKELKEFFDKGLIDENTFTRGMESLQKELDKNIQKANEFWRVMNGVDAEYVQGAEGIRAAVISKRAEGRMALDPTMSEDRARFLTRGESTREGTERKLVSVLELLEQHLRANPDPNKIALKTVGSITGVDSTP